MRTDIATLPAEIDALRSLHAEGSSVLQIATILDRSINWTRTHHAQLGLDPNRGVPDLAVDPATLRRLTRKGLSDAAIAERVGVAVAAVTRQRKATGIPAGRGTGKSADWRRVDRERLAQLHARGLSDRGIAVTLGVAPDSVWKNRKAMGLPANAAQGAPRKAHRALLMGPAPEAGSITRIELRGGVRVTICPPRWAAGARPALVG